MVNSSGREVISIIECWGGSQKSRKVQEEGYFFEHPKKGAGQKILHCC